MRVYKPTYTIPRPPRSRVLDRKDGKVCRWTDRHGDIQEARLTKSGKRLQMETTHFCIEFRDQRDILRRLTAFTDEGTSQRVGRTVEDLLNVRGGGGQISADLRRRVDALPLSIRQKLAEWGLLDERTNMAVKPLADLVSPYIDSLRAAERDKEYITKTKRDLLTVIKGCGFRFFGDIDPRKVADYLRSRREQGASYRRSNALAVSLKCFCNWLVNARIVAESPVRGEQVVLLDVGKDRRRVRRALEPAELRQLLDTTAASKGRHYGFTGPQRAMIYRLAAECGARAGELRKLKVSAFDFDQQVVTLDATVTKNGRPRVIPLSPRTALELRQYLQNKLPTARALPVPRRSAEMLRVDLKAAGIEYIDNAGEVFDFHSLRGECATLLIEGGVAPKTAQEILGHSDIKLTLQTYARVLKKKDRERAAIDAISKQIEKAG